MSFLNTLVAFWRSPEYIRYILNKDKLNLSGFIPEPLVLKKIQGKNYSVTGTILLSTGCYNPLHEGHIGMLTTAKDALKSSSLEFPPIEFGLLAPCHNSYVLSKSNGDRYKDEVQLNHTSNRDSKTYAKIAPNWIKWFEFEQYQSASLNFTTVIREVQRIYPNATIVYVYGSDNENFKYVFYEKYARLNVCVIRHSDRAYSWDKKHETLTVTGKFPEESSTKYRKLDV